MRPLPLLARYGALVVLLAACDDAPVAPTLQSSGTGAAQARSRDFSVSLPDVALQPGVTADLVARVYVDERGPACDSRGTVLALYGFAHTAATWAPLAEELFSPGPNPVCRVIALDLPGHGASGLPDVLPFAFVTLDDYARVLDGALGQLAALGLRSRGIVAHSQGGMIVQIVQQQLVTAGSSLRSAHGIDAVVLLAPTMPDGMSWGFVESGQAGQLLAAFLSPDQTHFAIPDAVWPTLFFSRLSDNTLVPGAPTPAVVTARGYNAPEALLSALQLVGAPPFPSRPVIDAGIFAPSRGTLLSIVAFDEDQILRPVEASALYDRLAGPVALRAFFTVSGPESVHDMFVSHPAAMLANVRAGLP
jgi:pimeloyl-ACP methyl ester carboxylesterase